MTTIAIELSPGTHERIALVSAEVDPATIPPDPEFDPDDDVVVPIEDAVARFLRAVGAGCFAEGAETPAPPKVVRYASRDRDGARVHDWEIAFPPLHPGAFRALARIARSSAMFRSGLVSFSLREQARPGDARLSEADLPPLPAPAMRFPVRRHGYDPKLFSVLIAFRGAVTAEAFDRGRALFDAWAGVLWGGFEGPGRYPCSAGFVEEVARHLPEEIVARIAHLEAAGDAWDALLRGLAAIDRAIQPIASVEIG